MNILSRFSNTVRAYLNAVRQPKSKHRKARGSWLKFNRKVKLLENPELANQLVHPFKPRKKIQFYKANYGHEYKKDLIKLRLGKLKPKQIRILQGKLDAAGISITP